MVFISFCSVHCTVKMLLSMTVQHSHKNVLLAFTYFFHNACISSKLLQNASTDLCEKIGVSFFPQGSTLRTVLLFFVTHLASYVIWQI